MLSNRKYLFFLVVLLTFRSHLAVAQPQHTNKDQIEVFVKGERYDSFYAYKRARLMKNLKKILPSSTEEHINSLAEGLLSRHSQRQVGPLTYRELETFMKEVGEIPRTVQEKNNGGDMFQMKAMLQNYFEEHKELESVSINPGKIKTIILGPTP